MTVPSAGPPIRPARVSGPELARLAAILARVLVGSHIDRVWRPGPTSLLIDLRALGKRRLFVSLASRHPWLAVTTRWPETPAAPDRETLVLRKCLEGARVEAVRVVDDRRLELVLAPRFEHAPTLALQLAGRYPNAAVIDRLASDAPELAKLVADRPALDPESPALPPELGAAGGVADGAMLTSDDAWLEAHQALAWQAEDARELDLRRTALTREARTAWQKKARTALALEGDLAKAEDADRVRHHGELLKASLHRIRPGMRDVAIVDWDDPDGREVVIDLDPQLGPVDNLQRLFARYKKLARGRDTIAQRLDATRSEAAALEAVMLAAERATHIDGPDGLAALELRLRKLGVRPTVQAAPRRRDDTERRPYRRFVAADGSEILVGRSARDNDALTFHVARGSDLFLHVRDAPGTHVILRTRGEPSSEALVDAATLAAWGSRLRGEGVVDVLYTERKHVKKPKGAPAGQVQTAATRTLAVRLDEARIQRLYATLDPHEREP